MAGNRGLDGLEAIASFYEELCPVREGQIQDADATGRLTHKDILEGVTKAMQRAMAATEGRLECRELEAMEQLCGEGGDVLSQMQVATFHAYWHRFEALPVKVVEAWGLAVSASPAPDCGPGPMVRSMRYAALCHDQAQGGNSSVAPLLLQMKHVCTFSWWIGLEEAYVRQNFVAAAVWLNAAIRASGSLVGLRRGWHFHVRYALGSSVYHTAFNGCTGDTERQAAFLHLARSALATCGREVAHQSKAVEDVVWALRAFGKAGKAGMKLQVDLSKVGEIYNDVATYARKVGQEEWGNLVSQLASGVEELEGSKELEDGNRAAAALKIFVEVLEHAVRSPKAGNDHLGRDFDLLSHACWWTDRSMRSLDFHHLTDRALVPRLVNHVKANVGEGRMVLGLALWALGREEEGLLYLESIWKSIDNDPNHDRMTLHSAQKALARVYAESGGSVYNPRKSAEMYEAASQTAPDLETKLVMSLKAAAEWVKVPQEFASGVEKMNAAVRTASEKLPSDWMLRAFLLMGAGFARLFAGDFEGGVEQMSAGKILCAANAFAFNVEREKNIRGIVQGLAALVGEHSRQENHATALALYEELVPVLEDLRSKVGESRVWRDTVWRNWEQIKKTLKEATGYPVVEDISSRGVCWDPAVLLNGGIGGGSTYLVAVANYYEELACSKAAYDDWEGAVDAWNAAEEKLLQRGVLQNSAKAKLHLNRAYMWDAAGLVHEALEEIQKAVDLIVDAEAVPAGVSVAAKIYLEQARLYQLLPDPDAARSSECLDKAAKSLSNGKDKTFRDIQMSRAFLHREAGRLEEATKLTCEVALLYGDAQLNLGMESVWVPFSDGDKMTEAFWASEILYRAQKDIPKAFIWAERARTRLFMHRAKGLEAKLFDTSDQFAEGILEEALELCGPGTVIIECSMGQGGNLILYGLFNHIVAGHGFFTKGVKLDEFFNIGANRVAGTSIDQIVHKVRNHIAQMEDERAIPGLTILYSLLVQSVWDQYPQCLSDCTNIIFAPRQVLHLIPFAALYDGSAKKFLIEQKAVGVIPSIRSLHHCLARQQILEDNFQSLDGAFVAGNPEPMGLGMEPLPGAAHEAQQVAEIMGVEACKGGNITKQAVVRALKSSSVVLLATHGLTKGLGHPYGALVLRGAHTDTDDEEEGHGTIPGVQEELLTYDEIVNVEGGIGAGLVALSACQTGAGKVSNEGLLGLGYALLQAGAASAMVALWDLDDDSMGTLMAEIFKELKRGTDVLHAVQKAMLGMLAGPNLDHRHLLHWSGLTVLGSPIFRLPGHGGQFFEASTREHGLDQCSGSQLSAEDIGGSTLFLCSVVHYYEKRAWQQEMEGAYPNAIATVNWVESRLRERGLLGAVAKSKLHLWRAKYLNRSLDGSRHALTQTQRAMEVLPATKKASELAAEILLEQAKAYLTLKDPEAAGAALDKAQRSVANSTHSRRLLHHVDVVRTFVLRDPGAFQAARKTLLEASSGTDHMHGQPPWIPFCDDGPLKNAFSLYETISLVQQHDGAKALVWADRGRTSVCEDDGSFDGSDTVAVECMKGTRALCGPDTLIIYLSYHRPNNLFLYGVHNKATTSNRVRMKKFFGNEANCVMGSSLEELVSRVRRHICQGEDAKAIPGLSVLHDMLVKPVIEDFNAYHYTFTSIIFAPQGFLCQIPFAALYDSAARKFLVEQNAVAVIPSIRALRRCFSRQKMVNETSSNLEEAANACFVGGNPEPMGLNLEQLPGASQAARSLGGILNVEPWPGSRITKDVLLEALTTRRIVVLVSHGVDGGPSDQEQPYPYGAVVLKQGTTSQDHVLTCEEIAGLKGKVTAGLVVLAACSTESSKEGCSLLGVGHAALEGGAVSVLASLWGASAGSLGPLLSATFRELNRGQDVMHSLQKAMVDTLQSSDKPSIRHWASLTVLGSPTLRPFQSRGTATGPVEKSTGASSSGAGGSGSIDLETMQRDCQARFKVTTDDGPTTLDTLEPALRERVLQYLAQQGVQQLQQAEEDGNFDRQIICTRHLGFVYGGLGEWSVCRQSFARSIRVAKDNWELIRTDPDTMATLPFSGFFIGCLLRLAGHEGLEADLDLIRFVLQSSDPTDALLPGLQQLLAFWD